MAGGSDSRAGPPELVHTDTHALRHFYASVLLDAGENIKALAEYLRHSDPGLTLRVYAHLMPSSQERTRKAVAAVFDAAKNDAT
ncbi:integrase [Streptomyces griseoluteus]|uniref:Integrase n=1 Tax=Streptomyces griseoluteus TaxID=29306 RepID=A0A4Z1DJW7_STRGP|nr:integrase [Streptomyces griseoluteus]